MKKEYEELEMEIIRFSNMADIITSSPTGDWEGPTFGQEWDGDTTTVPDFW